MIPASPDHPGKMPIVGRSCLNLGIRLSFLLIKFMRDNLMKFLSLLWSDRDHTSVLNFSRSMSAFYHAPSPDVHLVVGSISPPSLSSLFDDLHLHLCLDRHGSIHKRGCNRAIAYCFGMFPAL